MIPNQNEMRNIEVIKGHLILYYEVLFAILNFCMLYINTSSIIVLYFFGSLNISKNIIILCT